MTTQPHIIGLDIGGANLKSASTRRVVCERYFPLWKRADELDGALAMMLDEHAAKGDLPAALAITITGELADAFATRSEGVAEILAAVQRASEQFSRQHKTVQLPIYTYTILNKDRSCDAVGYEWQSPQTVRQDPLRAAASNWHCLATWIAEQQDDAPDFWLLIDIGSTTTDIIPIRNRRVATNSLTDLDRLRSGELVYTGIRRSPVCAVLPHVQLQGHTVPLMAEFFATSDDAYIALDLIAEDAEDCDTADGRPRLRDAAMQRLSRMVGEDRQTLGATAARSIAEQVIDAQAAMVVRAIDQVIDAQAFDNRLPHDEVQTVPVIVSGHGAPLWQRVFDQFNQRFRAGQGGAKPIRHLKHVSLEKLPPTQSRVAPALAAANLLRRAIA